MESKILILEDEKSIRSFIKIKLKTLNYEVVEAENGSEALRKIDGTFDIALLDVMLPDIDGFEICRRIRETYPRIGIIMITAKGQEDDKIKGLGSGADDYIVKPFSPKELEARIEALLRRVNINSSNEEYSENKIEIGPFILDINRKALMKNDKEIPLTPTEYEIVRLLISNVNKSVSRDEMLDRIWGNSYFGDVKIVDVNIRRIRRKIEEESSDPQYLKTVWGYGYMWSCD